ncbi:hypothetical protein FQA47_005439 [Oryzias melastigma]|uniref:Uncharacterized protein n=1 Tax=Oryzias melastigma TaxID=30732 RepID=A0A834BU37_ORYME|nr:hypothetical protein FQA47_005439 [Oryzias melastigma]
MSGETDVSVTAVTFDLFLRGDVELRQTCSLSSIFGGFWFRAAQFHRDEEINPPQRRKSKPSLPTVARERRLHPPTRRVRATSSAGLSLGVDGETINEAVAKVAFSKPLPHPGETAPPLKPAPTGKHHSGIQYYALRSLRELYATSAAIYRCRSDFQHTHTPDL